MVEAYPLNWPDGWTRHTEWTRTRSNFKTGFAAGRDFLMGEIRRLGGKQVVLSTNVPLRQDGLPYAGAREPQDPGAAVYFTYKGRQMCFACDQFRLVRENIHAIALTIEALRGIQRWGASDMLERAFKGFQALPAGRTWRDVLGFSSGSPVTPAQIQEAFRRLAHEHHPDKGGDAERFHEIVRAREQALEDRGER